VTDCRYISCWNGKIVDEGAIDSTFDPCFEYHALSEARKEVVDKHA
jgi:hypothetical protein